MMNDGYLKRFEGKKTETYRWAAPLPSVHPILKMLVIALPCGENWAKCFWLINVSNHEAENKDCGFGRWEEIDTRRTYKRHETISTILNSLLDILLTPSPTYFIQASSNTNIQVVLVDQQLFMKLSVSQLASHMMSQPLQWIIKLFFFISDVSLWVT